MSYFLVFLGGGIGSLCRYGLSLALPPSSPTAFPWGTFWANLIACLFLGLALGWIIKQADGSNMALNAKWLIATGFCGGFSTFSTFSNESLVLMKNQQWTTLLLYVGLSLILGLLSVLAGWKIMGH